MTYSKPEIAVLGDATRVVQGPKNSNTDPPNFTTGPAAFELED